MEGPGGEAGYGFVWSWCLGHGPTQSEGLRHGDFESFKGKCQYSADSWQGPLEFPLRSDPQITLLLHPAGSLKQPELERTILLGTLPEPCDTKLKSPQAGRLWQGPIRRIRARAGGRGIGNGTCH